MSDSLQHIQGQLTSLAVKLDPRDKTRQALQNIVTDIERELGEARAAIEGEPRRDLAQRIAIAFRKREPHYDAWAEQLRILWDVAGRERSFTKDEIQPLPGFCFECDDTARCASAETCYAHHKDYPKLGRAERVLEAAPRSEIRCDNCGEDTTLDQCPKCGNGLKARREMLRPQRVLEADGDKGAGTTGEPKLVHTAGQYPASVPAAAPLPTARELSDWVTELDDLHATLSYYTPPFKDRAEAFEKFLSRYRAALTSPQPVSGLQRTAGDVLRQFRESGSKDWGELESAINWWAMNDFCPNFMKGDKAEGRLREALEEAMTYLDCHSHVVCPKCKEEFKVFANGVTEPTLKKLRERVAELESA